MGMTLAVGNLVSRTVRSAVGNGGIRKFTMSAHSTQTNNSGGIIGSIFNALTRFGGWLISKVWEVASSFVSWSFSGLWGLFCRSVSYIWHFQWNVTDEQLDAQLKAAFDSFGGVLGGAIGKAAGSLIVLGGSATLFCFNEALAVHVLREVGEEALEEMAESAVPVIQGAMSLAARWAFNQSYKAVRNALGLNPDAYYLTDAQLAAEVAAGRMTQEQADKNKKGRDTLKGENKPWSFASKFEDWIESLPDGFIENFVEEFFEEGIEAITELGYVAFSSIDSYAANHKMGQAVANGINAPVAVQVQLHRNATTP